MRNLKNYKLFSLMLALVYILSACTGVPGSGGVNVDDSEPVVTFAGVVESMGAGQWTISGQVVNVDGTTSVDANIVVGDTVKVEAVIDQNGVPTAVKIESAGADDANTNDDNGNADNSNDDNGNDDNGNDDNGNDDNGNDNSNSNDNSNENDNSSVDDIEVIGILDAITATSVTIDGVEYQTDSSTEFKDAIVVGDQVKAHVIVNADGTLTVREIEKVSDDDNGNDDNSNDDNGNDDNGNDDNGNDDNDNDDNSNDDNSNDDNSNG